MKNFINLYSTFIGLPLSGQLIPHSVDNWFITGFTDGDGSFTYSIYKSKS
jgi:hypothetical protein